MANEETKVVESEEQELAERLQAAAQRKARFDERRARSENLRKVEAAEREAADCEKLEELIAKHGELNVGIAAIHTDQGMVVVKRPNHLHFKRYQDKANTGKITHQDVEQLVGTCLVHPSRDAFDVIVAELPATLVQVADEVASLAGVGRSRTEGK